MNIGLCANHHTICLVTHFHPRTLTYILMLKIPESNVIEFVAMSFQKHVHAHTHLKHTELEKWHHD